MVLDVLLWIIGVALAIVVASARAPWILLAGGVSIVLVVTLLVLHRHRRRAEYARLRAARAARRQRRVIPGA